MKLRKTYHDLSHRQNIRQIYPARNRYSSFFINVLIPISHNGGPILQVISGSTSLALPMSWNNLPTIKLLQNYAPPHPPPPAPILQLAAAIEMGRSACKTITATLPSTSLQCTRPHPKSRTFSLQVQHQVFALVRKKFPSSMLLHT